jgi:hypothetical protein
MVVVQALKTVGAGVLWCLTVVVLWRGAKCLKVLAHVIDVSRVCEKCGRRYMNPHATFCRDCGSRVVKAA